MSTTELPQSAAAETRGSVDLKLEVIVIPVSDVDRAKAFYERLGWRVDADIRVGETFRVVQCTPPGSGCSVAFGQGVTNLEPGTLPPPELVVSDIEAARDELLARGVGSVEIYHGSRFGANRVPGLDPQRQSYRTYADFADPDGNVWTLQEVTTRLPGRLDPGQTTYSSEHDLRAALVRAATAHGEHEQRSGERDEDWPAWYAAYMAAEQTGGPLPS
jgi:catechol 2,3-dioxygenase-like lactoylglutathione lyase family enzyme